MNKKMLIFGVASLMAGIVMAGYIHRTYSPPSLEQDVAKVEHEVVTESRNNPPTQTQTPPVTETPSTLPKSFSLKIPFSSQAPTANWDELHNEACEETSSIMAHAFLTGRTESQLPVDYVEDQIAKITEWEKNHFGYFLDINSEETVTLLKDFYGLNAKIVTDYDKDDIKQELNNGHVVLFSINGKLLGNPNFRSGGPPYHMIVIRGYNGDTFITNDPGTRKGMNYPYDFNVLYKANGDFDHETHAVDTTKKHYIVVWK